MARNAYYEVMFTWHRVLIFKSNIELVNTKQTLLWKRMKILLKF
jgi:hypothetical protein